MYSKICVFNVSINLTLNKSLSNKVIKKFTLFEYDIILQ